MGDADGTTKTILERVCDMIDSIGQLQTVWGLIVGIALIFAFALCLATFRKKVNRSSQAQMQSFVKAKKYEPSLYIELNRNMECLRYFVYAYRWRGRLIRQYNQLFSGYDGRKLKATLGGIYKYHLPLFSSIKTVRHELTVLNSFFESIRNERTTDLEKFGEYFFVIRNLAYDYIRATKQMLQYCDMIQENNILLVGSAGNGKTNLMCRVSEIAIANKIPLMLVNARDVDTDCVDYILNRLPLLSKFKNLSWLYLRILSICFFIQRKHFYILIDAINENDREVFIKSIGQTIEYFSKYHRIRIAFSCRSEYFESRFRTYFANYNNEPFIFDIMSSKYDERASNKMLTAYGKHFNFKGAITYHAKERLLRSLFLMRIFFEVNSNQDGNTLELRNAEIYLKYINKVNSEIHSFNFLEIVNKIAGIMITNSDYSGVKFSELAISGEDKKYFTSVLDDNLIISRTIFTGSGITERSVEIVYFVFDELRDFCLARYLLTYSEDAQDTTFGLFFQKANEMFVHRQSPIEGVLKYAYYYFKTTGFSPLSNSILTLYGESSVQVIADDKRWHESRRRSFSNFGLSLIFIDGGEIDDFELEYIQKYISKHSNHYWNIFWFLLANEYSSIQPRLDLALKLLLQGRTFKSIESIIIYFFADRDDYRHRYSDEKRRVDILCDWIEHIKEHNDDLSVELKQILIILSAINPHEYMLCNYRDFFFEDNVYNPLLDKIPCQELIDCIQDLKEGLKPNPVNEQKIHQFLLSLLQGGVNDDC